jgi:hypothetical protein
VRREADKIGQQKGVGSNFVSEGGTGFQPMENTAKMAVPLGHWHNSFLPMALPCVSVCLVFKELQDRVENVADRRSDFNIKNWANFECRLTDYANDLN